MSDEASPRPWRVNGHSIEANDPDGLWLQNEKTGRGVVANLPSCPKSRMSKKNRETWDAVVEANAALIVDAVNHYKPDLHCDWRELTPEEAIAHCREVAARLGDTPCARDHLQLAAWIEERDRLAADEARYRAHNIVLRDIVRRLADLSESLLANYEYRYREDPNSMAFVGNARDFIREARAAIGDEKQ